MFRFLSFLTLLFACSRLSAATTNDTIIADYVPFLKGQPWPRIPVVAYVETKSNIWVHPSAPKKFPTVQEIHAGNSDFTIVIIRSPDGTEYKTYNKFVQGPYLSAVYSGDFNNDGIPDFMAIKPGTGNGLAAEYCTGVFAFSHVHDADYTFTRVATMGLGPYDLVLDPTTKDFRFIYSSFRQGDTLDGNAHSFWVHRFYKWKNERFKRDDTLPDIWIQYLVRPNHIETKLLNQTLKTKIWSDDPESEPDIEW